MGERSFTLGMLAVTSPLLVLAAFVGPNVREARFAVEATRHTGIHRPVEIVRAFHGAIAGRAEAQRDIRDGKLALLSWGLVAAGGGMYADILRSRYGIELRIAGGCVVSPGQTVRWEAYNEEMLAEITRRHGPTVLSDVEERVRRASIPRPGS